jgi:hypothetical protein
MGGQKWSTAGRYFDSSDLHGIADPFRDITFRKLQNNNHIGSKGHTLINFMLRLQYIRYKIMT